MSAKTAIRGAKTALKHNSPVILTGMAMVGVGTTAVLAVKATPGAMEDLKAAQEKKGERLTKTEAVKVAAPHYIPAGISGLMTCGAMALSTKISLGRAAGAAAVATAAQNALAEHTQKVEELFGKEKAAEVRDAVAADHLNARPDDEAVVTRTGDGDHLCFDVYSGRYFRSDIEALRKAENDFNHRLLGDLYLDLNEWYYRIGLEPVAYGYQVGFNPSHAMMELVFGSQIAASGEPCLTVDFRAGHGPVLGYDN